MVNIETKYISNRECLTNCKHQQKPIPCKKQLSLNYNENSIYSQDKKTHIKK